MPMLPNAGKFLALLVALCTAALPAYDSAGFHWSRSSFDAPSSVHVGMVCSGVSELDASASKEADSLRHVSDEWTTEDVGPGVQLRQRHFINLFDAPQFVSVLAIGLDEPAASIRLSTPWLFGQNRMAVPELGCRAGALAAINGGFAHGGEGSVNSGIFKIDDKVYPFLPEEREELRFVGSAALGIDRHGEWHFIERPGDRWPDDWKGMPNAIAGGHMLLVAGMIHPSVDRERFDGDREKRHAGGRHPRTAACTTGERTALLVAVDGRHEDAAEGLTLRELASFMKDLGCRDALNLDGGGSTTMWTEKLGVVNHPSDNGRFEGGGARAIRTALIVVRSGSR